MRPGLVAMTLVAALAVLAAAAWLDRDQPWLRALMARATAMVEAAKPLLPNAAGKPATPSASSASLRKCLRANGEVLYTDEACPSGTRAQAVGGQLTVVPGQPPAPAAAASLPHARDILLKPDAVDIKAQRMEAVIGQ